jgi:hypothetical protein
MHLDSMNLRRLTEERSKKGRLYDCLLIGNVRLSGEAWIDPDDPDGVFFKTGDLEEAGKVTAPQGGYDFKAMDYSKGTPRQVSRHLRVLERNESGWLYLGQ